VGVGAGVGHGELSCLVEFMGRTFGFVFELVAGAAHARALRVAALDHEVGDDAMENCSIIKAVFGFLARRGMRPLALTFGEFHKVGYGFGRVFFEEAADDIAFAGFKRGVESGLAGHGILSESVVGRLVVSRWPVNRLASPRRTAHSAPLRAGEAA